MLYAPVDPDALPASQLVQSFGEEAAHLLEYFPDGQLMHTEEEVAPGVSEYVPCNNSEHTMIKKCSWRQKEDWND